MINAAYNQNSPEPARIATGVPNLMSLTTGWSVNVWANYYGPPLIKGSDLTINTFQLSPGGVWGTRGTGKLVTDHTSGVYLWVDGGFITVAENAGFPVFTGNNPALHNHIRNFAQGKMIAPTFRFAIGGSSATSCTFVGAQDRWYMLTCTYEPIGQIGVGTGTMKLYVNGVLTSTQTRTALGANGTVGDFEIADLDWQGDDLFGQNVRQASWYGLLDECAIWDKVLDQQQVWDLFASDEEADRNVDVGAKFFLHAIAR